MSPSQNCPAAPNPAASRRSRRCAAVPAPTLACPPFPNQTVPRFLPPGTPGSAGHHPDCPPPVERAAVGCSSLSVSWEPHNRQPKILDVPHHRHKLLQIHWLCDIAIGVQVVCL